jgi:cytosine/adenosine deaminase-related metal-dependent hydrolase
MSTHWARNRSRGPKLPLELVIKTQTADTAAFFGFNDRGRLAPGLRADVNVIDYQKLHLHTPRDARGRIGNVVTRLLGAFVDQWRLCSLGFWVSFF